MKGAEGRLVRKKNAGIAHIREGIKPEGRRRFTIAHELGHWELHKGQTQFICSEEDMRDYGRSYLEVEANLFAASLLMPQRYFAPIIKNEEPSMDLVKGLAKEFETTLTASAIRLADLSHHQIIVVWAENRRIQWSYRNEKTTSLYVVAGGSLPEYSSATVSERELISGMGHYDQANWFPQLSRGVGEVMEETLRSSKFGTSLTLLWLPR